MLFLAKADEKKGAAYSTKLQAIHVNFLLFSLLASIYDK